MARKKVLIIAGGGVFGAIPAHFLGMLPNDEQNLDGIDMLAGCSIGGILAAAYATKKHTFSELDSLFQTRAEDCFCKRLAACINPMACPTYNNDSIDAVLLEMIGNATMGDTRKIYPNLDLVIPALNITDDEYLVFNNYSKQYRSLMLREVAGYTSAAPSYYYGRSYKGKCIVDGGVIEVAPLLTATTALRAEHGVDFSDMDVLMLGTGKDIDEDPVTLEEYNDMSILGLATKVIVPYVTLSNEMATRYWGNHIGYGSFTYFNPCVINGDLDDINQIPGCIKQCEKYKKDFLSAWNRWLEA